MEVDGNFMIKWDLIYFQTLKLIIGYKKNRDIICKYNRLITIIMSLKFEKIASSDEDKLFLQSNRKVQINIYISDK